MSTNIEHDICPDCERVLKPKRAFSGLNACFCLWNGRKPSLKQMEDVAMIPAEYERRRKAVRERLGLPLTTP